LKNYEPHQYTVINKNNHTTSTKCQYQAAASKPKCCSFVKANLDKYIRQLANQLKMSILLNRPFEIKTNIPATDSRNIPAGL